MCNSMYECVFIAVQMWVCLEAPTSGLQHLFPERSGPNERRATETRASEAVR